MTISDIIFVIIAVLVSFGLLIASDLIRRAEKRRAERDYHWLESINTEVTFGHDVKKKDYSEDGD